MNKGLTVPKCVLIVWPKILLMPQNISAQNIGIQKKSFVLRALLDVKTLKCKDLRPKITRLHYTIKAHIF